MKAENSKITIDLSGLEELRKQLGTGYKARVGILGAKSNRSNADGEPIDNATLGMIQEYGSATNNIPPRSFLRMPIELKMKEIVKFMAAPVVKKQIEKGNIKEVFRLLGVKAESIVQMAFESRGYGQWAPNTESTIASKGSSSPLIDTGQLRRAITSDVVKTNVG